MGGVYERGNKLWIWFYKADGKRDWAPTGLDVGQEKKAQAVLEKVEAQIAAERQTGLPSGELTVRAYAERWLLDRERREVGSVKDDRGRLKHALPFLGATPLTKARPGQVRDLFRELRRRVGPRKEDMAPRLVRHVYSVLHRMFEDAVADELIPSNPCVLKRGELPPKVDKDPTWRPTAIYTRAEVEQLISDARVPEERRTLYGLLFLGSMRIGEVGALRVSGYERDLQPLGRIVVAHSYNRKRKRIKSVKTGQPRQMPVHPTLAKLLGTWLLGGWQRYMGRPSRPDDLLVPAGSEGHLKDNTVHANLLHDLEQLGLRSRRTHDTRRTFITLAVADGARKDLLKWVTHGPSGDIMDMYMSPPWDALCAEVAKLRVELRTGQLVQLRQVSGMDCDSDCDSDLETTEKPNIRNSLKPLPTVPRAGLEAEKRDRVSPSLTDNQAEGLGKGEAAPNPDPLGLDPTVTTTVTVADPVSLMLTEALRSWSATRDAVDLRSRLISILGEVRP
jgi:integrase